jgi:uncharacterized protein YPO0396
LKYGAGNKMTNPKSLLDAVVEMAMEMEKTDPTDFGMLPINEEDTYRFIANSIVDKVIYVDSPLERELMLLSACTHLVVENFVLNQRLMRRK